MREEQLQKEKRKFSEIDTGIPQIKTSPPRQKLDLIEPAKMFQIILDEYKKCINEKALTKEGNKILFNAVRQFENHIDQMKEMKSTNDNDFKKFIEKGDTFCRIIDGELKKLNQVIGHRM